MLYLGGLLGQLLGGYRQWLDGDGIMGGVVMPKINASPFYCIPRALSAEGIKGTLGIAAIAGGIVLYALLSNRFSKSQYDDRNFRFS